MEKQELQMATLKVAPFLSNKSNLSIKAARGLERSLTPPATQGLLWPHPYDHRPTGRQDAEFSPPSDTVGSNAL